MELTGTLEPPNAIVRNYILAFLLEIDCPENDNCDCAQS
jgi:hypothetical protein